MKYTKGPWEAKSTSGGGYWTIRNGEEIVVYSAGLDFTKNKEGNAKMIAAAPEMYEALKDILGDVASASDDGICHLGRTTREKCGHCRRVDAGVKAIKKAEEGK